MIKLWYSYGVQPGSALILIAFLGVVLSLMTICIDYAELAVGRSSQALESGASEAITEIFVMLEMVFHIVFLGYGVIVKGMRKFLIAWMVAEGIYLVVWEGLMIWFLIEEIGYLSANTNGITIILALMYFILYTAIYYGYEINLAMQCLPLMSNAPAELEPVGKGFRHIFEYFKNNARAGASLAIMSEIMMNFHVFLERHVTEYGLDFDYVDHERTFHRSVALFMEETVVRYSRVIICIVGFYLTFKERTLWMFRWCIAYLVTLMMSWGIFVYMVFMWRAVHSLLTIVYFSTFALNLLYRTGVLYMCVRYSDAFARQVILPN